MKISKKVQKVVREFGATQRLRGSCPSGINLRGVVEFLADVVHDNVEISKKQLRASVGLCKAHGSHWAQSCDNQGGPVRVRSDK